MGLDKLPGISSGLEGYARVEHAQKRLERTPTIYSFLAEREAVHADKVKAGQTCKLLEL